MTTNEGKNSEDLIRETKEELDKSQEPSHDYSLASKSSITTADEDERKRNLAEGIISDLSNQRNEIDSIKEVLKAISDQYNQLAKMVNEQTKAINTLAGVNPENKDLPQQGLNMDNLTALGDVAEKLMSAWKSYKGSDIPKDDFTQQIVERSKKEAFESLDIVSLINQKVKKNLVNEIASNVAGKVVNASSESSHAPQ